MMYCRLHNNKAYTEPEANSIPDKQNCPNSGWYQNLGDNLIRVYCFKVASKKKGKCSGREV